MNEITQKKYEVFDDSNNKFLECSKIESHLNGTYQPISDSALQSLSGIVPALSDGTYRVTFSPDALSALQRGDVSFQNGYAVLKDKSGHIYKHPKLVQGISPSQIAGLAFTIGSVVFAQQHLANISKELAEIKEDIQKILEWQEHTDLAALQGRISWLEDNFFKDLSEKGGNPDWQTRIQDGIAECHSAMYDFQEKLILEVASIKRKTDSIYDGSKISDQFDENIFGTKEAYKKFLKINNDIKKFSVKYDLFTKIVALFNVSIRIIDPNFKNFNYFKLKNKLHTPIKEGILTMEKAHKFIFSSDYKFTRNVLFSPGGIFRLGHHLTVEKRREEEVGEFLKINSENLEKSLSNFRSLSEKIESISLSPENLILTFDQSGKISSGKLLDKTSSPSSSFFSD